MTDLGVFQSEEFIDQLIRHEGAVRDKNGLHVAYVCPAGALTIGYGHNLDAAPIEGVTKGSTMTEEKARALLRADVVHRERYVQRRFPWVVDLNMPRRGALVNMAFNMGMGTLGKFTNMLNAMREKNFDEAAFFCIYRADRVTRHPWVDQVKGRAWELAAQIRTGDWQKGYEEWMRF